MTKGLTVHRQGIYHRMLKEVHDESENAPDKGRSKSSNHKHYEEITISDLKTMGLSKPWLVFAKQYGVELLLSLWETLSGMDKKQ